MNLCQELGPYTILNTSREWTSIVIVTKGFYLHVGVIVTKGFYLGVGVYDQLTCL